MTSTDELLVYANSRNGLGIRILGARRATNKSGIYIKQLLDEGLAQRDGRLKVGMGSTLRVVSDRLRLGWRSNLVDQRRNSVWNQSGTRGEFASFSGGNESSSTSHSTFLSSILVE